jgi:hypothetical protein
MDNDYKRNRYLSELLYCDTCEIRNKGLKKGLEEYQFLVTVLNSALIHFENKDFEKFDSLVGENACQIRAIKLILIASENKIDIVPIEAKIKAVKAKLKELLQEKNINALMHSDMTLKDIVDKEDLQICLSHEEMFIFQSFLLTEMKEPQPTILTTFLFKEKSTPKNIKRFTPNISSTFTYCIASKMRRFVAEASVNFIRELALQTKNVHLMKMVSKEFTQSHNSWPCIPMFWTYKILLEIAQKKSIPFIIHAKFLIKTGEEFKLKDEELLFFKPAPHTKNGPYILCEPNENDLANPACVIQGIICLDPNKFHCKTKWKEELLKYSIVDIILAGAADHRQYPNPSITIPIYDPEYEQYKSIANDNGFSINNPTTFFINHVYTKQVEKIFPDIDASVDHLANS